VGYDGTTSGTSGGTTAFQYTITLSPGQSVLIKYKLKTPFVQTTSNPTSGSRKFSITGITYQWNNGNNQQSTNGTSGNNTSIGLPINAIY
jgi:hypothetical protein